MNTLGDCKYQYDFAWFDACIEKGDWLDPKFKEEDNELSISTFDLKPANFPFSQENPGENGGTKRDKKGKVVK